MRNFAPSMPALRHKWAVTLHIGKATPGALFFGDLNYHYQISIKDKCRGDAYGCVYTQPECAEG